jgi:hypothetical protein
MKKTIKINIKDKYVWWLLYIFSAIMIFNAVMDLYVWFAFEFHVPAWVIAGQFLGYPALIFTIPKLKK